jgi:hypothetical protein
MFRKLLINSLLSLCSLLFCLIVAEMVCRIFFPDTRLKYEADPELLVRFKPNQDGFINLNNGLSAQRVRINELGLRGTNLQNTSSRRILFLGDSFTFGLGVEENESFATLVGYALGEDISVINGGQPGYGIYQMEALLRGLAPIVRPELVVVTIWQYLLLRQPLSEWQRNMFFEKSEKIQRLKSVSVLGTHLYRMYERLLLSFEFDYFLPILRGPRLHNEPDAPGHEEYRHALEADSVRLLTICDTAHSYGAKLMLVFWPREGFSTAEKGGISTELISELEILGENNQIPFYSVQNTLEAYPPEKLVIPFDGHPTPFAHCLVARKLMSALEELGYHPKRSIICTSEGSS